MCRRKKPGTLVVRACSYARRTARMVVRRKSGGPANALAYALAKREESWRATFAAAGGPIFSWRSHARRARSGPGASRRRINLCTMLILRAYHR